MPRFVQSKCDPRDDKHSRPIDQPAKFEFVFNLVITEALGLDVSGPTARPRRRG
jgi:hypothetical protein